MTPPNAKTALIIDDDAVARFILSQVLGALGYSVMEATTGRKASALLDVSSPQLVLVDGLLPDTDGARWLRKERDRIKGRVVFASSFFRDMKSFLQLTNELRVSAVIPKPFVLPELRARLAAL